MPRPAATLDVYFAYGSNLDRAQMRARCPRSHWVGWGWLGDHRLAYVGHSERWGGGVATVQRHPGDRVPGFLYFVTEDDLRSLDRFEAVPKIYRRKAVTVRLGDGSGSVRAWTYQHTGAPERPPGPQYLAVIQKAHAEMIRSPARSPRR